eukprot:3197611-Pleurochrysis_carterae.AAC.2
MEGSLRGGTVREQREDRPGGAGRQTPGALLAARQGCGRPPTQSRWRCVPECCEWEDDGVGDGLSPAAVEESQCGRWFARPGMVVEQWLWGAVATLGCLAWPRWVAMQDG